MARELLSLADASALLGVSSERVRQLVVAGDLPGVRFGNAWAVPRDAVAARRQVSNRRGRPLAAGRAWEVIAAGDVDLSNVSRFRNRGLPHRYSMSGADVEHLSSRPRVLVSGVRAAIAYGELLQEDAAEVDLYMAKSELDNMGSVVAAVPDPLGSVVIREVDDDALAAATAASLSDAEGVMFAPRAAVALDLVESGDPRHWVAAEHLVASVG